MRAHVPSVIGEHGKMEVGAVPGACFQFGTTKG